MFPPSSPMTERVRAHNERNLYHTFSLPKLNVFRALRKLAANRRSAEQKPQTAVSQRMAEQP